MKHRELIGLSCLQEVGLERKVVDRVLKTLEFPAENKKYKDFLACTYKKQGFQSEDGKIMYDNINNFLSDYYNLSDLKALDTCKSTTGNDHGEKAFNAMVCIMDQLKTIEEKNENDI